MKINFPYTQELIELDKIFNIHNKDNLRIVGGAVRNFLLNKKITDYDLSCKYTPDEILDILNNNNIKALTIGKDFGTITAIINHKSFEITSTREDIQTDGRHAIVKYTNDFRIDAERRDFTFNALYLDFNNNLYDYFNGVEDLKNGIVRFIGNPEERIKEDYLRILRLFRFYSFYANTIEKDAFKYSFTFRETSFGTKASFSSVKVSSISDFSSSSKESNNSAILDSISFNLSSLEVMSSFKSFNL